MADLTLAEQTFQLQLRATRYADRSLISLYMPTALSITRERACRNWGLDSQGSEQAVAFAFGQGQLWQQFTASLLMLFPIQCS